MRVELLRILVVVFAVVTLGDPSLQQLSCANEADVIFLLDSSGSIDVRDFALIKAFVVDLVNSFDIDAGDVRVGVATFADSVSPAFNLTSYRTRSDVQSAIRAVRYTSGATNTSAALNYVHTMMFTDDAGNRAEVADFLVLITDGGSDQLRQTSYEAWLTRSAGIHCIVIGVGTWVNVAEMNVIASYPYTINRLLVANLSEFSDIRQATLDLICNNYNECSTNPCRHDAACIDEIEHYSCLCPPGTAGRNCERVATKQIDLVIAVDAASRVGVDDYLMLLDIGRELVFGLNIAGGSRVGALTFSDDVHIQFYLNTSFSMNKMDIIDAMSMPFFGGSTNLSSAIHAIRTQMYATDADSNSASEKIAVLMVDGPSVSESESVREAILARQAGIQLLVVGISESGVPLTEWHGIASYPATVNIFTVPDYVQLPTIVSRLIASVNDFNECFSSPCMHGGTCVDLVNGYECLCTSEFTGANCERAGSGKLDVIVALDVSGSIRNDRFFYVLSHIASLIEQFEIGVNKTQVGVILFNDTTQVLFHLNTYRCRQDIMYAVQILRFNGGRTNISGALSTLVSRMFLPEVGDRADAPNLVFMITDGNSNIDVVTTVYNAIVVRQQHVSVFVLSIGSDPNVYGLWSIASEPVSETIYFANSFRDLPSLLNRQLDSVFVAVDKCLGQSCQNGGTCMADLTEYYCLCPIDWAAQHCQRRCAKSIDLAFVLDMSSGDFDLIYLVSLPFIKQVSYGLPVRPDRVRLSFVTAVGTPTVQFNFNTYSSANPHNVYQALSVWPVTGSPCTPSALYLLNDTVFTAANGHRLDTVPSMAIFVTDADTPSNYSQWVSASDQVRLSGIELFVVAVGTGPDPAAMAAIAGGRDHVTVINNASEVTVAAESFLDKLCL